MKKTLITLFIMFLLCGNLLFAADKVKVEREIIFNDVSPISNNNFIISQNRDLWDILGSFNCQANGQPGIETNNEHIFTCDWRAGYTGFYKYDMDGAFVESFDIGGASQIRDMAYDGTYFYGSPATMTINIMDLEAQTNIGTIPVICDSITGVRHIAYDPELDGGNGGFWIGNWNELGAVTMDGAQIYGNINPVVQNVYGSAYDPWSAGGPYLWLFSHDPNPSAILHQFDIATQSFTGVTHDASDIPGYIAGIAGGLATYVDANGVFAMLVNIQQNPNLVGIYEIMILADPQAPGFPTGVAVTPDAGGALETDIDWVCPTVKVNGDPLTELLEMRVYRDEDLIYTDSSPVIGAAGTYTDNAVPASGLYTYKVVGYNSYDEGLPFTVIVWVGEDVPDAVTDLTLTDVSNEELIAQLDWENPTTGLHGGTFNEPILGYNIKRLPDNVTFEIAGIATDFLDNTIPGTGYYSYEVTAYNSVGNGGTATSNVLLFGGSEIFFEDIVTTKTELLNNYPNPFNPKTNIAFSIKEAGYTTLEVYNMKGQLMKTLVNEVKESGNFTVIWDGKDNSDKNVSSGIYFYKMKAEKYTSTKKMILMK